MILSRDFWPRVVKEREAKLSHWLAAQIEQHCGRDGQGEAEGIDRAGNRCPAGKDADAEGRAVGPAAAIAEPGPEH